MAERLDYFSEPGRHYALEYKIFAGIAGKLANRFPADAITALGALFGIAGSYCLISPEDASKGIENLSKGRLRFGSRIMKFFGGVGLVVSYVCDLLDGAVTKKSDQGETKHGKVLDGIVNKMVDVSPAIFILSRAEKSDTKITWTTYKTLAAVSTMIRSEGLTHEIPISKTGLGARIGRLPFLITSLLWEKRRDLFGKVLIAQLVTDSCLRYSQIVKSGNQRAIRATNRDLVEYFGAIVSSELFTQDPTISLGVGLTKLAQVKIGEAYKAETE